MMQAAEYWLRNNPTLVWPLNLSTLVLSKRRLEELCNALWKGYVDGIIAPSVSLEEFRTTIMFALALGYYSGLGSDRPVYRIYRQRLGWRYARALRRKLSLGRGSLF